MKWSEIQDTVQTVVQDISGLSAAAVSWEQLPQGFIPDSWIKLSLGSVRKLGYDETRYDMDYSDTLFPVYREVRYGVRVLNVVVKVESRDQRLAYGSQAIADRVRTRLYKVPTLAILRDEPQLAVSSVTDIRTIDRLDKNTGRNVSYSVFEINFSTYVEDMDTSEDGAGWIETTEISHGYDNNTPFDKTYPVGVPVELGGLYTQDLENWIGTQDGFVLVTQYQYSRAQ